MAVLNNFINVDMVAPEALIHLQDNLVIKNLCTMDKTAEFNKTYNGHKVGDSVAFKTNPVYEVKTFDERASDLTWVRDDTKAIVAQNVRSSTRTMYIEKHFDVSVTLSARELAMHFDEFNEAVVMPATKALAAKIDAYLAGKILQAQGLYASTTVISTKADLALMRKAVNYQQLTDPRFILVNPDLEATLMGSDWFNGYDNRGDDTAFTNGFMSKTLGFDFYSSINFPSSTTHTNSSGTTTTAASPSSTQNMVGTSNLIVAAITGGFTAGDRIAVAGTKRPMVVKTTVAAGATSIALVDPITELIPASAAVTVVGGDAKVLTYVGAAFDSQSIAAAMPLLDPYRSLPSQSISDNGVSIRVAIGDTLSSKLTTMSLDCLVGAFLLDPRRVTLLANAA